MDICKFHGISATVFLKPFSQVLLKVAGGQVPETEVANQEEVDPQRSQHSHHLFEIMQVAVYWLLRAAEQGQLEARETLVALAGDGRGLTEQNYVDVAAVVRVAPNVAQGQFLGRTLFRTLSRGQVWTFFL